MVEFLVQMLLTSLLTFAIGGSAATRIFAQAQRLAGTRLLPMTLVLMIVCVYVINGGVIDW